MAAPSSMAVGAAQVFPATASFAGKFNLDRRPCFGNAGNPISLLGNHYRVRFDNELFHYDVSIEPRPPKGFNYRIIYEAFKKNPDPEAVNNVVPAYDVHKSLSATSKWKWMSSWGKAKTEEPLP